MSYKRKLVIALSVVSLLLAALCLGCGGGNGKGEKTIVVGMVTDFTGPTAPALKPGYLASQDIINYVNKEDPIPGARLKLVAYDQQWNPARDIPAYDFLKERGASVIVVSSSSTAETLKAFLERDKVAIWSTYSTKIQVEPAGWIFASVPPCPVEVKTLLDYVSKQWDYEFKGRKPRLGCVGWAFPGALEYDDGTTQYCQAHPDAFDYVGMAVAPVGTTMWHSELERLRQCDYILLGTVAPAGSTFLAQFRSKGYTANILTTQTCWGFTEIMEKTCGKEALDGTLSIVYLPWEYPCFFTDLAKKLLYDKHPGEADDVIRSGLGYSGGGVFNMALCIDILREAVKEVGAENFNGQAFYNAAVKFKMTPEGFSELTLADGVRYALRDEMIWQYSAESGGLVKLTDWLPLME